MRYVLYIILLYVFLPFNLYIDLIAILIFFIVFKEHEVAVLVLSFFAGLLIDLYHPVMFGLNTVVYVLLVQGLLYVKKYIAQNIFVTYAVFIAFYLVKILIIHLALASPYKILPIIITVACFLPAFVALDSLVSRIWMEA